MKLPYGIANFAQLREEGYLYIDKTRYIELLENMPERHIVILRSRRFGKTLFANMLSYYYGRSHADRFKALFRGTYIGRHPTPKHNAYLVLYFNFSGINTESLENANQGFTDRVRSSLQSFIRRYGDYFAEADYERISQPAAPNAMLTTLFDVMQEKALERSVYGIIDEYDHFANNILSQGKEMFKNLVRTDGYVRPFYEALKTGTESVVDRLFITGVLPILLDSLTSGFNIGTHISTDERFNEMFGFTEAEIAPIIEYLGTENRLEEVRTYYNGYRFSPQAERTVYNSDMILYYGLRYVPGKEYIESMIDVNVVSDYTKIRAILSIGDRQIEEAILTRLVEEQTLVVNQLTQLFILTTETEFLFDAKALLSLLFYMGYLTITGRTVAGIELQMPNLVLKSLYLDYMQHILMKRGKIRIDGMKKDEMLREMLRGNIDLLIELTERLLHGLSNRDYERFDEKYIKVVMLSLLSDVNLYIPHSEYAISAEGYVDLYLQAVFAPERSAHYFVELKYVKAGDSEERITQKEKDGVTQMQRYLQSTTTSERNLHAYVLVFQKDRCVRKRKCE